MRDTLRAATVVLMIVALNLSALAVTCLQHSYQGRLESHHSIFELYGDHKHPEPLSEAEDDCQLTSADDHLLLVLVECKSCLMAEQSLLLPTQPFESFTAASSLTLLKGYHAPPVKPPTFIA